MKLSEETLAILKNFSTINSGIVFRVGNTISTLAEDKSVMAKAQVVESFPVEIGIYDLNQFLGNIITMEEPELAFKDNKIVTIKDKMFSLDYRSCNPEFVISPPVNKELEMGKPDISFDLTSIQRSKIMKLATMNALPNLTVVGKNGKLNLVAHERGNDGKNTISAELSDWSGEDVSATFKTELLNILPKDYLVEIKTGRFAKFSAKNDSLYYFISLEK